ncbi:MAG: hypothetical protein JRI98_13650 [Deltaproteobacteria bacterium]|nr:hypothetical protein [Deltaproteobacteria bacterium]
MASSCRIDSCALQIEALGVRKFDVVQPVTEESNEVCVRARRLRGLLEAGDDVRIGGSQQVRPRGPSKRCFGIAKSVQIDAAQRCHPLQPHVEIVIPARTGHDDLEHLGVLGPLVVPLVDRQKPFGGVGVGGIDLERALVVPRSAVRVCDALSVHLCCAKAELHDQLRLLGSLRSLPDRFSKAGPVVAFGVQCL